MEEISKSQIARLVLGYLKQENYKIAYNYFYKNCPYFIKYRQKKIKISTRYNGLALDDILLQYSEINSIVQPRLEDTDFYENRSFHYQELPQQLIYLLEHYRGKSKSCSPTRSIFTQSEIGDANDYLSSIETSAHLDVSATPLKTLPGNSIEKDLGTYKPRRSGHLSSSKSQTFSPQNDTETDRDESSSGELDKSSKIEDVLKAFSDSLLADEELQAKIAHTINEVRATDAKQLNQASNELDTAIKSIIDKTETDPAFEILFDDLLGTAPTPEDNIKNDKQLANNSLPSTSQSIEIQTSIVETQAPSIVTSAMVTQTPTISTQSPPVTVNEIASSSVQTKKCNTENLIVIDNSNQYVNQPPMLLTSSTSSNVVMFKSPTATTCIPAANVTVQNYIDPNKPIFYIGTAQNLANQYIMKKNLTEQDILSMPTVILFDEKKDEKSRPEQAIQVPEKTLTTLMPVNKSAQNLSEYITMYKCDGSESESVTPQHNTSGTNFLQPQTSHFGQAPNVHNVETVTFQTQPSASMPQVNDTKTPEQPKIVNAASNPTPRSGSRSSHVRALDFKFQTPAKEFPIVATSASASPKTAMTTKTPKLLNKTSKSLFSSSSMPKEPWDMKFRSCLATASTVIAETTAVKPTEKDLDKKEAVLSSPNENIDSTNNNNDKATSKKSKKKKKTPPRKGKKASSPKKKTPTKKSSKAKKAVKTNETTPVNINSAKSKIAHLELKDEKEPLSENCISLINLNKKLKLNKQCNIDNRWDDRKVATMETETKLTKQVVESEKLVLSPSKLNGNKRSLVELEVAHQQVLETPECKIEPTAIPPSAARRNIMPNLETPGKDFYPATPCVYSPASVNDTPFTKVFKEQMTGVDINSIPTPKIILTPSFPYTPMMGGHQSPVSNRPTDYSTSSSYYQPSDTEQNQSLEKLIRECTRLESEEQIPPGPDVPNPEVVENLKRLSGNVIARKNLNLMKEDNNDEQNDSDTSNSSCSSNSSSSSSSNSDLDNSFHQDWQNEDTVVEKKRDSSVSRYTLRSQHSPSKTTSTTTVTDATSTVITTVASSVITIRTVDTKDSVVVTASIEQKDNINEILKESMAGFNAELNSKVEPDDKQLKILKDMDVKRKRMIESLKNPDNGADKKGASRLPPKKRCTSKIAPTRRVLRSNSVKLKDLDLHLSSSEEEDDKVGLCKKVQAESFNSHSNTAVPDANPPKDIDKEQKQNVPVEGVSSLNKIDSDFSKKDIKKKNVDKRKQPEKKKSISKQTTSSKKKIANTKSKTTIDKTETATNSKKAKTETSKKKAAVDDQNMHKKLFTELEKSVKLLTEDDNSYKLSHESKKSAVLNSNIVKIAVEVENCKKSRIDNKNIKKSTEIKSGDKSAPTKDISLAEKKGNQKSEIESKNDLTSAPNKNIKKAVAEIESSKNISVEQEVRQPLENHKPGISKENTATGHKEIINPNVQETPDPELFISASVKHHSTPTETEQNIQEKKRLKGTTGEAAVNLLVGLKERGIHLMPNPNSDEKLDTDRSKRLGILSDESDSSTASVLKYFKQTEEKIGACISTINTPDSELIYLDFHVVTEPLLVHRLDDDTQSDVKLRDTEDDKFRLLKLYKMSVYDDTNDGEIDKVMTVTPFECIFDCPARDVDERVKRKKIRVLDDVLIKKEQFSLKTKLKSEDGQQPQMAAKSPLEDLYKTETKTSNRYNRDPRRLNAVIKSLHESKLHTTSDGILDSQERIHERNKQDTLESDSTQDKKRKGTLVDDEMDNKRIKIDDHQLLLKNINVDDVLQQIHG